MDPSPFHERDLDHDAEEFIESWVSEYHRHELVKLVIHLQECPQTEDQKQYIEKSVHNYFAYKARLNKLEFNRLMRVGRMSLGIGLLFLSACLIASKFIGQFSSSHPFLLLQESLTIAGTVAMWRPMEIYLYEWWPLRRRGQIFEKMSKMPVELHVSSRGNKML